MNRFHRLGVRFRASTVLVFFLLFLGLSTRSVVAEEAVPVGEFVFDCYYRNTAWGYQLHGIYVDRSGKVHEYDRDGEGWLSASRDEHGNLVYTEDELVDKFGPSNVVGEIDEVRLRDMIELIPKAAKGDLLWEITANDAGQSTCSAYEYSSEAGTYTEVILGSTGDAKITNSTVEANQLLAQLKSNRLRLMGQECRAVFENGVLHIPCIMVNEFLDLGWQSFDADFLYNPDSGSNVFELIRLKRY